MISQKDDFLWISIEIRVRSPKSGQPEGRRAGAVIHSFHHFNLQEFRIRSYDSIPNDQIGMKSIERLKD